MPRILLIDDELDIRGFMQLFFEDRGYDVEIAEDGLDGVEKYKKGSYDLVCCDMMMPGIIGVEVLRRIKAVNPKQRVIMITGVKEESMVKKAKDLGCHFYLNKPFNLSELEARVNECFDSPA